MTGHLAMAHIVTITDPSDPDAMPIWESLDHATFEDAYRAAHDHITAAQPDDRIVAEGHGIYAVVTPQPNATRVATIVISPGDDPDAAPGATGH